MKSPIDEVLNRVCPSCKGTKKKMGQLMDGTGDIGVVECICCKGRGKVTEAKYHEKRKQYGYIPEVKSN